MKKYAHSVLTLFLLLFTTITFAEDHSNWKIVPDSSTITFTATQNNSPVSGEFKRLTGNIYFDPSQLQASHIQINVDMNSISTSYDEVETTLKTADWFNVSLFPDAVFKTEHITKIGNNEYTADGTLKIRDKTLPLSFHFILDLNEKDKAHVKGSVILKRTQFGIGQGDWNKTDVIKDNVNVAFIILAVHTK